VEDSPLRCWRWLILAATISGCTIVPERTVSPELGQPAAVGACARFFADLDAAVAAAELADGGAFTVAGFPYLRVDRFLASFRHEVAEPAALRDWVARMQALDRTARRAEIAQLSPAARAQLGADAPARIERCGDVLRTHDLAQAQRREQLRAAATVPDEYLEWQRLLGVYPIMRWFVLAGVADWQAQARTEFSYGPVSHVRQRIYRPAAAAGSGSQILRTAPRDALGIPQFSNAQLARLFAAHAPVWQVEAGGEFDRIGRPVREPAGPTVDARRPVGYQHLGFTRFDGEILTQLSYVVWFSQRPARGALDILAGRLDSVVLRVTLDADGRPLLYDSIHSCGCWHQFFPTPRLRPKPKAEYAEPPLVFGSFMPPTAGERLVVALASGSHYIRALYSKAVQDLSGEAYELLPYTDLLTLPGGAGPRSLFEANGLVRGSERLERYLFWPLGVPEPGASRQAGRQPTAFVGKRHFDDPDLLDRVFDRQQKGEIHE
jgi:hypothetical protein